MINRKENYCIYVENYNDWIELQKYLFENDFRWVGLLNKSTIFKSWQFNEKLVFPRLMNIDFINRDEKNWDQFIGWTTPSDKYIMSNVSSNHLPNTLKNAENRPIIKCSAILRKVKLQKLNEKNISKLS